MAYKHQGFKKGQTLEATHLIAMEDAIIETTPTSYKYSAAECIEAFVEEMNKKATLLGATNCTFVDPIGVNNTATAYDMARIMLNASDYEKLYDIWNTPTRDLRLIQSDGSVRTLTIKSTVVNGDKSPVLGDSYNVMGGKTGSLSGKSTYNLVCICQSNKEPDDWYIISALKANTKDTGEEHRFQAAKEIMDIVESTYDKTTTKDSLDDIAWEGLSYRDIFITNNKAPKINQNKTGSYAINAGAPEIINDTITADNYARPYYLKCFGSGSQQLKSNGTFQSYPYFAASNVKIDRYVSGYCGIAFSSNFKACQSAVTDGWVVSAGILEDKDGAGTTTSTNCFVGSASSADLDGYVNNPVLIPMNIFTTAPTEEEMIQLYKNYTTKLIEMGGTDQVSYGADVCCEHAYAIKKPNHNSRAFRYLSVEPVYEKDSDVVVYPASTTKILTSLVCLDYVPDLKGKVLISQDELDEIPSGFYAKDLLANETITFEDLLYAMYLPSSNAACVIVARNVGERILRSKNL